MKKIPSPQQPVQVMVRLDVVLFQFIRQLQDVHEVKSKGMIMRTALNWMLYYRKNKKWLKREQYGKQSALPVISQKIGPTFYRVSFKFTPASLQKLRLCFPPNYEDEILLRCV
ncbi:MAG: hypothetical protein ACPGO5_04850 [Patescibacteria group bacterium]